MKKLITVIAVLLLLVGCTVVQNAADSIQRNFKLQQLEYGLSLKDSLILNDVNERTNVTGKALYLYQRFKNKRL